MNAPQIMEVVHRFVTIRLAQPSVPVKLAIPWPQIAEHAQVFIVLETEN